MRMRTTLLLLLLATGCMDVDPYDPGPDAGPEDRYLPDADVGVVDAALHGLPNWNEAEWCPTTRRCVTRPVGNMNTQAGSDVLPNIHSALVRSLTFATLGGYGDLWCRYHEQGWSYNDARVTYLHPSRAQCAGYAGGTQWICGNTFSRIIGSTPSSQGPLWEGAFECQLSGAGTPIQVRYQHREGTPRFVMGDRCPAGKRDPEVTLLDDDNRLAVGSWGSIQVCWGGR